MMSYDDVSLMAASTVLKKVSAMEQGVFHAVLDIFWSFDATGNLNHHVSFIIYSV